jgi:hypothetical protein
MERYIDKMVKRFHLEKAKMAKTPVFDEHAVYRSVERAEKDPKLVVKDWNLKAALGCLQWCSTVCRPDVAQPISALGRLASRPVTAEVRSACKRIMTYLNYSKLEGVYYSKEHEQAFETTYKNLVKGDQLKKFNDINLFSDASFASCYISMRSISGAVLYYRGTAVHWRCCRQTLRTYSSMSAEWVAGSDALVLGESTSFLDFFRPIDSEKPDGPGLVWLDAMSTIQGAQASCERPRSRHLALRWFRLSDECARLCYTPANLQKADALTKTNPGEGQRRLILHTCAKSVPLEDREDEIEEGMSVYLTYARFVF